MFHYKNSFYSWEKIILMFTREKEKKKRVAF